MTRPSGYRWHLHKSGSHTYCGRTLSWRLQYITPTCFYAQPAAHRCVQCDQAYQAQRPPQAEE